MEENNKVLINTCNFRDVNPIMVDLPYPEIRVQEKNTSYAHKLSQDYAGAVSELTAIAQYISSENRMSYEKCPFAKTIVGIAMAEMIHLQKLGELIYLLGGNVEFCVKQRNGSSRFWTAQYVNCPQSPREILRVNIESEKAAINQYRMHVNAIKDGYINAVLERIIQDEEYHIMILQMMMGNEH